MKSVGQAVPRAEGKLKVTGAAQYTADIPSAGALHAAIVHSTIANGRIVSIDTHTAERSRGVVAVFTHRNLPQMNPTPTTWSHLHPHGQGYLPMQDDQIHYAGQPVVLVVARNLDEAAHAGTLVEVEYDVRPLAIFEPSTAVERAVDPPQFLWPVSSASGDPIAGLADGTVRVEQVYTTADRHHNQMEPHATLASWDVSGSLTIYETTQHISGAQELISIVLGMPRERISIISRFVGGGFGGKAYVWPHTLLAALAAREVKRPVRLELTRAQMYSMTGHQPASVQTLVLAADPNGRLTGIRHESITPTSIFDNYIEYAANASRSLWDATGGIATTHKVVHVNRNTPTAMRAPHEALGHFALESAMDELAYRVGVDPVQIRLANDAAIDPYTRRPFSTRGMRRCLMEGALRFGWDRRSPAPRSMRDGRYLVGQGVAGAIYTHWRWPARARVTLRNDGSALVESGMHEIGGGTYTVMRQVAADALGIPPEHVEVRLGETRLPPSHAAIGSATMANAGASVLLAATAVRDKAIALAIRLGRSPLADASIDEVSSEAGGLAAGARRITYAQLLRDSQIEFLAAEGHYDPVEEAGGVKAIFSFSAVFAEVRVDEELGLVRLSRFIGAYDAGRIINPLTARSQAIGGIIWGVGQALFEQSETDPMTGRYLHRNCSGYLVPTHADIPELDVIFAGEFDAEASPLGSKGMGELTAVSVAPAIANAVFHATGKRIRSLPITVDKLL